MSGCGHVTAGAGGFHKDMPVWWVGDGTPQPITPSMTLVSQRVHLLPHGISVEQGATLGLVAITALEALRVQASGLPETVLIHEAAGALGSTAAQLALDEGHRVIATVRNAEEQRLLARLGVADAVLMDLADSGKRLAALAPQGVDRILGATVADQFDINTALLRPGGLIVTCPQRRAKQHSVIFEALAAKGARIQFLTPSTVPTTELMKLARVVNSAVRRGALVPVVAQVFPMSELKQAVALMISGRSAGSVVVRAQSHR